MKFYTKKIYFILIKSFFDFIYSKLHLANKDYYKKNVNIFKVKITKKSKKSYKIYEINKGRIYSDLSENVAVIKEKYLLPEISVQIKKNCLTSASNNSVLRTGTRKFIQKKIKGNLLSLVQGASAINNYGHWVIDILPKIFITEKFKKIDKFSAIYLPNINHKFQKETFKILKINRKTLVDGSKIRHLSADKITIPQHPYWEKNKHQGTTANIEKEFIQLLRKKFLNKLKKTYAKKIFIDRSDSKFSHSQIENYEELIDTLKKNNFKIIKLANMPLKDQISYFYNCNVVVGAHGAGLCNSIFCRRNAKLIEIRSRGFNADLLKKISKINKLKYYRLSSSKGLPKDRLNPDIFVPIKKLLKLIN